MACGGCLHGGRGRLRAISNLTFRVSGAPDLKGSLAPECTRARFPGLPIIPLQPLTASFPPERPTALSAVQLLKPGAQRWGKLWGHLAWTLPAAPLNQCCMRSTLGVKWAPQFASRLCHAPTCVTQPVGMSRVTGPFRPEGTLALGLLEGKLSKKGQTSEGRGSRKSSAFHPLAGKGAGVCTTVLRTSRHVCKRTFNRRSWISSAIQTRIQSVSCGRSWGRCS